MKTREYLEVIGKGRNRDEAFENARGIALKYWQLDLDTTGLTAILGCGRTVDHSTLGGSTENVHFNLAVSFTLEREVE